MADGRADEVDLTMVTMTFDAVDPGRLQSVLARYVVLSRGHHGCRNIDLALSATQPEPLRDRAEVGVARSDQRAHFDSADMVDDGRGLRRASWPARPPIDLLDADLAPTT